jgi:uncharacterized membrane protein YkoI
MRKLILAIAFAAAAFSAAEPVFSQARFQGYGRPRFQRQIQPPPILLIPPSQAIRRAQEFMPGARVIGVRPAGRSLYVVKLKQGNRVMRVQVDGATGAVLP